MKKLLLLSAFCAVALTAQAQYTAIPDPNFETALATYDDIPGDGQVPTANISTILNLNVSSSVISDLTGIEDFTALVTLDCSLNQLVSLNVSNLANLENLSCFGNQLSSLDVSGKNFLISLDCSGNQLTNLDINGTILLQYLYCYSNQLSSLYVSENDNL